MFAALILSNKLFTLLRYVLLHHNLHLHYHHDLPLIVLFDIILFEYQFLQVLLFCPLLGLFKYPYICSLLKRRDKETCCSMLPGVRESKIIQYLSRTRGLVLSSSLFLVLPNHIQFYNWLSLIYIFLPTIQKYFCALNHLATNAGFNFSKSLSFSHTVV